MRQKQLPLWIGYGAAVVGPAVSLLLRLFIGQEYERALYIAFCPAIMIAAYLGGVWPGLLATGFSALAVNYFFIEPRYSFSIATTQDAVALAFFVLVGTFLSVLSESLHRARHRIAANERRYAVTLASIGDAVIATDMHARVTFLNPAAEALTGWPLADAVGRPLAEVFRIVNEQTRQPVEDPAAKVLRLGTQVGLANHTALRSRDGRELPIDDCAAPILDDRERLAGVVLVFRDVTARRRTEEAEALRRVNELMRLALRGSHVGVWQIEMRDGDFRHSRAYYVNMFEQLGHAPPSSAADFGSAIAHVHPEDRHLLEAAIRRYLAGETSEFEIENRVQHKDGSCHWMLIRGEAVRDAAGKAIRFAGTAVDITDRKQAEGALRESEDRFRGTFENAAVGIAHEDFTGQFFRLNGKFCEILGYSPVELTGKTVSDVTHPEDLAGDLANFGALTRRELSNYTMEKRFVRKDGTVVWAQLTASLQFDAGGKPAYCIKIIQDISERKSLENELRRAKGAAEAASQSKDEFLANVSHEVRTPLNAILGMTDLALDTSLTVDQRQNLKTVKSAGENLLRIINDLLDFSKIEAGKLELDLADFSLRKVLGETLRALAMRAHRKGLELVNDVQPDVPDALIGDAGRLRQVLLNLVGNAIKFTEKGEVIVGVEIAADPVTDNEVELQVRVSDTGIGISPDKQATIFRAFEQEDTSTTRKYGGTGLGLTIAAQLVDLMGGTIMVDSAPDRGSTFSFTARFGRQLHPAEPVASPPPPQLDNLPVLIVDDNATNRHILETWLRDWKLEPTAVADGMAAMDSLWNRTADDRPYALVLLDARLADTSGLTVAAMIRERPALANTHIILLTSGERNGDSAKIRELRIDARLLKPVQQDELLETIYQVLSRADGDAVKTAQPYLQETGAGPPTPTSLHILVAEDDEFSAQILEQFLTRRGHRLRLTNNGREALALAEGGMFDLLILDIHMPEMDGFEVVRAIRERERTGEKHLPIVALTARSRKEDRELCFAVGMDDFQTKPIRPAELLAAIERLAPASGVSGLVQSTAGEHSSLLDPVAVLAACGSDEDALQGMCRAFQNYVPDRVAELRKALRDKDAPRLREAAHKISALLFAFSTAAGNVASEVEGHAAEGGLDKARPLVEKVEVMAQQLLALVSGLSLETLRQQTGTADDPNWSGDS